MKMGICNQDFSQRKNVQSTVSKDARKSCLRPIWFTVEKSYYALYRWCPALSSHVHDLYDIGAYIIVS